MNAFSLLGVAAIVLVFMGCGRKDTSKSSQAPREEAVRASAIAGLVLRLSADHQWVKPFDDKNRFGIYIYELQRALIRSDGRPIVLVGSLDDILRVRLASVDATILRPEARSRVDLLRQQPSDCSQRRRVVLKPRGRRGGHQ
jgi:hypothetical protein